MPYTLGRPKLMKNADTTRIAYITDARLCEDVAREAIAEFGLTITPEALVALADMYAKEHNTDTALCIYTVARPIKSLPYGLTDWR